MASAFVADSATVERRREQQHVVLTHSQYLCGAANPKGRGERADGHAIRNSR